MKILVAASLFALSASAMAGGYKCSDQNSDLTLSTISAPFQKAQLISKSGTKETFEGKLTGSETVISKTNTYSLKSSHGQKAEMKITILPKWNGGCHTRVCPEVIVQDEIQVELDFEGKLNWYSCDAIL